MNKLLTLAALFLSLAALAQTNWITFSVTVQSAPTPDGPWADEWWVEFPYQITTNAQYYRVTSIVTNAPYVHEEVSTNMADYLQNTTPTNTTNIVTPVK